MDKQADSASGPALTFGRNWLDFLDHANREQYARAAASLEELVGRQALQGAVFFDLGCGSGLFSLSAATMGASRLLSLDLDPDSVAACLRLQQQSDHPDWQVRQGSVLDRDFLSGLGRADVVYSWGVLHHTGSMWQAIDNACGLVSPGGLLVIAIYNHTATSGFWLAYKRIYHRSPAWLRRLMVWGVFLPRALVRLLRGRHPFKEERGMSIYRDAVDWCLGLPYEYASFEAVRDFVQARGFVLENGKRTRGTGCNEFVFRRKAD